MKLEFYNGTTSFDVTPRVASIEPLHESIGDDNGYVVPTLKFKLDNSDDYYRTFINDIKADRVWVRLSTGSTSIFTGFLTHDVPMISGAYNSLIGFEADHVIGILNEFRWNKALTVQQAGKLKIYLGWLSLAWHQKPIQFDFMTFQTFTGPANLNETAIFPGYFSEPRTSLEILGHISQLYGAAVLWQNDAMTVRDYANIATGTPTDITPMITSNQEPIDKIGSIKVTGGDYTVVVPIITDDELQIKTEKGAGLDIEWTIPLLPYLKIDAVENIEHIKSIVQGELLVYMQQRSAGKFKTSVWIEQGWTIVPGMLVRFDGHTYLVEETHKHIFFESKFKTQLILRHFKG